ncbi:MAG: hypothetical protein O8C67_15355 [Candidatus Methanoperedens sp.]|nr:hypothetical protein [Candidatus Methanoperedens sp.]
MVLTPMRQSASWKSRTGSDGYTDTYSSSTIACRFQPKQRTILKADGTLILSSAVIKCAEAIKANDRITINSKESVVLTVNDIIGLGGGVIEREVWI